MKHLLIAFIALSFHSAHANSQMDFAACEDAKPIALLAKDNNPYWAHKDSETLSKLKCYDTLKTFAELATSEEIAQMEDEFEGRVRIFRDDASFAKFIQNNAPEQKPYIQEASVDTNYTVVKPKQTFFTHVSL